MNKLVCESLDEAMVMTLDRSIEPEERFVGNYVPQEYRNKFAELETPRQKRRKSGAILYKQSILGTFKTAEELENAEPQDNDWILRSADGNGNLLLFNGDIVNNENVNDLKTYYKIAQDVNYLDARPILYKHWKRLPERYKMASRRKI